MATFTHNNSNNSTLADLLRQPQWTSFENNLACCILMILYAKACLECLDRWFGGDNDGGGGYIRHKPGLYGMLSGCILFWPLFRYDPDTDWSWRLNCIVPCAMGIRFLSSHNNRNHSITLLLGPTQYALLMVWLGLYQFQTSTAAILVAAVGVGDALLAPWVGTHWGRHVYYTPLTQRSKTMEGSVVGVFLGTCAASYLFLYVLGIPLLPLRLLLAYSAIAATAEGTSPEGFDNVVVACVLQFSMHRVEQLLNGTETTTSL